MPNNGNNDCQQIIEDYIDELINYVWGSKTPFLGDSSRSRVVDAERIDDILNDLRTSLPENIRLANSILREEARIKELAHDEADRIVDDATRVAEKLNSDAGLEAQNTIDDANNYHEKVTAEADRYEAEKHAASDGYYDARIQEAEEYYESRHADADGYYENKIAMAQEDANRIIADAEAEAERLVSESEITREANERAENLRRSTIIRSNKVYNNARQLADNVLEQLMNSLVNFYNLADDERTSIGIRNEERSAQRDEGGDEIERENHYTSSGNDASASGEDNNGDDYDEPDKEEAPRSRFSRVSEFFRGKRQQNDYDEEEDY